MLCTCMYSSLLLFLTASSCHFPEEGTVWPEIHYIILIRKHGLHNQLQYYFLMCMDNFVVCQHAICGPDLACRPQVESLL